MELAFHFQTLKSVKTEENLLVLFHRARSEDFFQWSMTVKN